MKQDARRMAVCAMMTALSVVLMVLGAVLELGMYACPLFAGLCFVPIGQKYGRKYHIMLYVAAAILCFLLVPNIEENLVFAGFFGWYPILRPSLQKLPKVLGWICKVMIFNGIVIAIEWLVVTVLVPEVMGGAVWILMLVLGNILFVAYDLLVPRVEVLMWRITRML